ncbi:MAG TPA: hypothetical protein VMV18_10815, partial [bacterium]|nr:hypothetical protein [bacterium]
MHAIVVSRVIFTCPRCRRTKDFGSTYIPPLGRSYICPCGLSTVVRPSWSADGRKELVSSGPKDPAPATPKQQKQVAVPVDAVKERLAREEAA